MGRTTRCFTRWVPLLLLTVAPPVLAQEGPNSAARLQKVIRDAVGKDGSQFIGLGSWISNKSYADPLTALKPSDHDIRLVLPQSLRKPPTDPTAHAAWRNEVLGRWKNARDALYWGIQQEFGKDADKILRNTNLYAPVEIMRTVEKETARDFFIKAQQVPRMDFRDAVPDTIADDLVEGMYGKGTEAYTQKYESQAGRHFYRQGQKVFAGRPDLAHLAEMEGKGLLHTGYNPAGTGNTARQWIEHCDDAIKHGKPNSVAKYLERLEQDLAKGRDLARAGPNSGLSQELKRLSALLRANKNALAGSEATIREVMRQAKLEAALLRRFQYAGALQKGLLTKALQGLAESNGLGKALKSALATGGEAAIEHIGTIFTVGIVAYETSQAYDNKDPMAAWTAISPAFATLGTTLLLEMTKAVIEGARDLGYALTAGQQNAFDLLEGEFTARGRADVAINQYTIDQLVNMIHDESGLQGFVMARAQQAANRGLGEEGWVHDAGSAQAIYDRCYPVILRAWRAKREQLQLELQYLYDRIATERCMLQYDPVPAALPEGGGEIVVTVSYRDGEEGGGAAFEMAGGKPPWDEAYTDMPSMLVRAKQIIRRLVPTSTPVFGNVYNKWSEGGLGDPDDATQQYRFTQPGTYTVTLKQEIRVGASNQEYGTLLADRFIKREMSVDVVVEGKEKPKPATGVWVLSKHYVEKADRPGLRMDIRETTADITSVWQDGVLSQHNRYSWTAPPATLVPGGNVTVRLSAQIIEWQRMDKPSEANLRARWDWPDGKDDNLTTKQDSDLVSQEFTDVAPPGRADRPYFVKIQVCFGNHAFFYVYEYAYRAPGP